jgi:hypothetical protein
VHLRILTEEQGFRALENKVLRKKIGIYDAGSNRRME